MVLGFQIDSRQPITVKAAWDPEAETIDGLREKLSGAIEDLLQGGGGQEVQFELITPGSVKIPA
jgi:hypothetical protein